MALINRPMYEHFGARHLGVKGPGALGQIEEGVMGVVPLDIAAPAMYWNLQGIRSFSAYHGKAGGGAGTYAKIGLSLENTDEETLAQILEISCDVGGGGSEIVNTFRCLRTAFSSDPGVYGYGTDTRIPEAQHSQAILISNNLAANPGQQLCTDNDTYDEVYKWDRGSPLIISPGQAIYVKASAANVALEVCFKWLEIPAYKAEL